jgi:ribonuclease HI
MELMAVCAGLEALKVKCDVTLYSDSKYVVDSIEKGWIWGWERKRFLKVKNPDLWIRLLKVLRQHNVRFVWVKGHAGNPENERCDQLATTAAAARELQEDRGYNGADDELQAM